MFEVVRERGDKLRMELWRFNVLQRHPGGRISVVLDSYSVAERKSTRRQYDTTRYYQRIDQRHNTVTLKDVPVPSSVIDEARQVAISMIDVVMDLD